MKPSVFATIFSDKLPVESFFNRSEQTFGEQVNFLKQNLIVF